MSEFRRSVRDAYDEVADGHDEHRKDATPELPLVGDVLEALPADAHVLDAGCGAGDPIGRFLTDHVDATGLDFSRGQLALARERAPEMALVQGDLTALPFAADRFDGLLSIYAVIHVPREQHEQCFAEFRRVCTDGAPVLVTVGRTDWEGSQEDWMGMGAEMHWDIPGEERTRELMDRVGFTVENDTAVRDPVSEEEGVKAFVRARA